MCPPCETGAAPCYHIAQDFSFFYSGEEMAKDTLQSLDEHYDSRGWEDDILKPALNIGYRRTLPTSVIVL